MYEYLDQDFNGMSPNKAKEIIDMFEFLTGAPKVTLAFRNVYGALERLLQDMDELQKKLDALTPPAVEKIESEQPKKERKPRKPKSDKL